MTRFSYKWIYAVIMFCNGCLAPTFGLCQLNKTQLDSLDHLIQTGMKNWGIPGLAIGIVNKTSVVYQKGYGVRDITKPGPVDSATIFNVGSVTKQFTAASLCKLVTNREINIDDRVKKYIPELRIKDKILEEDIRIKDLLCHRSGIESNGDFASLYTKTSRQDVIQKIKLLNTDFPLRNGFAYSNYAFILAGEVFSSLKYKQWDDYLKDSILYPLGMYRTQTVYKEFLLKQNVASPHHYHQGKLTVINNYNYDNISPAGGLSSSVSDMTAWLRMLLNNGSYNGKKILPEEAIRLMFRAQNITTSNASRFLFENPDTYLRTYALGWRIYDYKKVNVIEHNGQVAGMTSQVFILPEYELGIVVLSNYDVHELERLIMSNTINLLKGIPMIMPDEKYVQQYIKNSMRWKDEVDKIESKIELDKEGNEMFIRPEISGKYYNELYGFCEIKLQNGRYVIYLLEHENLNGIIKFVNGNTAVTTWNDIKFYKSELRSLSNTSFELSVRPSLDEKIYIFKRVK